MNFRMVYVKPVFLPPSRLCSCMSFLEIIRKCSRIIVLSVSLFSIGLLQLPKRPRLVLAGVRYLRQLCDGGMDRGGWKGAKLGSTARYFAPQALQLFFLVSSQKPFRKPSSIMLWLHTYLPPYTYLMLILSNFKLRNDELTKQLHYKIFAITCPRRNCSSTMKGLD